jgi:hypothetical protein
MATRKPYLWSTSSAAEASASAAKGKLSVGRAWKFRRNLVIFLANKHGASQPLLADVFDLPHSRIAAIVKEFRSKYEGHSDGEETRS